jgi:hypothetical protein
MDLKPNDRFPLVSAVDEFPPPNISPKKARDPIAVCHFFPRVLALQVEGDRKDALQKEMTHMKRTIAIAFLASAMIMSLSSASAQGRSRATIPFDFRVGSALLPAGAYDIESTDSQAIWFRSLNGHGAAVAQAMTTSGETKPVVKLVFNRYGNQYFLSETLTADGESDKKFAPSKLEKSVRTEEASLNGERHVLIALK